MRQKIDHLEYAHLQRCMSILEDIAERSDPSDFDTYGRALWAPKILGDMLEHDLEPIKILTRPMDFRSLVTVQDGGKTR